MRRDDTIISQSKGKSNLLKKMMAMLFTTVLIIGMAVGTVPEEVYAATYTEGYYTYSENKDGTVTITRYTGSEQVGMVPSTLGNKKVTAIGEYAFNRKTALMIVEIPEGVISIGNSAFQGCSSLMVVEISESVTSIGGSAFQGCSSLMVVEISEGVTSIGESAFNGCSSLMTVDIPGSVTSIGEGAFQNCGRLREVRYGSCKHKWAVVSENESKLNMITQNGGVIYDSSVSLNKKEKAATCTEDGYETYYECSGCDQLYSDANGETPLNEKIILPAKGHTPANAVEENRVEATCSQEGSYDEVIKCSVCDAEISREAKAIDKKPHSYGDWTVTKQSTESEEGLQERSCSVCNYKLTEVIPIKVQEDTGLGKIETDKELGENTPDADFGSKKDDLISAVLTPEEQGLVKAGKDIKIILDIDNIDASVNSSDKQAVIDKADEYKVGQYLDINMYKIIGEDKTKIPQTTGKIKIVITIPDAVKNTNSEIARNYAIVRVHNGVADLLTDLDNDEATITIETDRFSTYALVYKDTVNTNGNTANTQKDDVPKTGDAAPIEVCAMLAMIAGLSFLLLFLGNRKRGMKEQ